MDSGAWVSCPGMSKAECFNIQLRVICKGQDNPSTESSVGDVPNIFESNPNDHIGPYDGVDMGC
jgi:hypothetical protein